LRLPPFFVSSLPIALYTVVYGMPMNSAISATLCPARFRLRMRSRWPSDIAFLGPVVRAGPPPPPRNA
jgi:hypothetical protein